MTNEVFVPVLGYEEFYSISNIGNVKSHKPSKSKSYFKRPSFLLKPTDVSGYKKVSLSKNNSPKNFYVHRLVAIAFIPNPENKPHINHINGLKLDNRVENLEWVTAKENINHSWKVLKKHNPIIGLKGYNTRSKTFKINK